MSRHDWFPMTMAILVCTLLLEACTFSVEVLSTPTSSSNISLLPTHTPVPPTFTPIPPTEVIASATSTRISIRPDTLSMLETFQSFQLQDSVRSLAFTPDSMILAASGGNTEGFAIHVWDVASEENIAILEGHSDIVWGVAFSPDGKMLASVSSDRTARIWNWRSGEVLKILDFPGEVVSVRFSPDGQRLAIGGVAELENQVQHAAIWTYSVGSWEPLIKFPEYMNITAMAYSPKGSILVGGGTSRNVQVWAADEGIRLFTFNHAHQVFEAAISPDGSVVATATCESVVYPECPDGGVWLWDLHSGKLLGKVAGFPDFVESVAFTVDGSSLIAASREGTVRFYSTSDYQPLFEFASPGGIGTLAVSPDGGLLATGDNFGAVNLWKIADRP